MEDSMSPVQKALRRFASGRPPVTPKNSPLPAVNLATEQRARLTRILAATKDLEGAAVTSVAVVTRARRDGGPTPPSYLADVWPVIEGKEGNTIVDLQQYGVHNLDFRIIGLIFGVLHGGETYPVAFLIERTEEGATAMMASFKRQTEGRVAKPD